MAELVQTEGSWGDTRGRVGVPGDSLGTVLGLNKIAELAQGWRQLRSNAGTEQESRKPEN